MKLSEAREKFSKWRSFRVKKCTVKRYDLILKQFCLYVRDCEIEHIKLEDVTSWFSLLTELKWQHNSFITKAQALRKFFEFYKMQGYLVLEPMLASAIQTIRYSQSGVRRKLPKAIIRNPVR